MIKQEIEKMEINQTEPFVWWVKYKNEDYQIDKVGDSSFMVKTPDHKQHPVKGSLNDCKGYIVGYGLSPKV